MHDVAVNTNKERTYPLPRRANDCIADPAGFRPPAKLFDECWREGDLALLFAPPATGKSILAVQIAEALARGEPIDGLDMPEERHRVLYVDLVHSDEQFHSRRTGENGRPYKFSDSFHRDAPPPDLEGGLIEWLREVVRERRYRAVIIDDLTAIRSTYDGTRETLKLMRQLRALKNEFGISILVLAQSRPPRSGEGVAESNMLRSRVLCDVADSVFAIGRHSQQSEWLFLNQIRSRNAPLVWYCKNSPFARIYRRDDGLLAWRFDERFDPKLDAATLNMVRIVKGMQASGISIRKIGLELGITRSRVERLLRKWRPSHGIATSDDGEGSESTGPESAEPESPPTRSASDTAHETGADEIFEFDDDDDGDGDGEDEYITDDGNYYHDEYMYSEETGSDDQDESETPQTLETLETLQTLETLETRQTPQTPQTLETLETIFLTAGCEPGRDGSGAFIWVEKRSEDGKPLITYQPHGERFKRWKYDLFGRSGTTVDGPVCILRE